MQFEMRALWREGYLIIDGRVWYMDVSIDKASELLADIQQEFPKTAPRTMYIEPSNWF
jgi:hypothetical protein